MSNKLVLSWADIESLIASVARDITLSGWKPDYIVGLTRGGVIPAVMLSHYFGVPMYALHVSLRDNPSANESNCWMAEDAFGYIPEQSRTSSNCRWDPTQRSNILIVDDINDSGATIAWIKQDWARGCFPDETDAWASVWNRSVKFAMLVDNLSSEQTVDYVGRTIDKSVEDVWVDFAWEAWWQN